MVSLAFFHKAIHELKFVERSPCPSSLADHFYDFLTQWLNDLGIGIDVENIAYDCFSSGVNSSEAKK